MHLYSLLLAAKQSEAPVAKFAKHLAVAGLLAFIVPILVFIILRIFYILKTTQQGNKTSFDGTFLVYSAGLVSIGIVIVLMYLYQTHFGSLYLHIGIISSVFMVGLTTGAALIRHLLLSKRKIRPEILLFVAASVHTIIFIAIAFWPAVLGTLYGEQWTHLTFAIAFVLCGVCAGCYFPVAARQLADSDFEAGQAGSKLEIADHLGAAEGGVLTSLLLVPVLGTKVTLFVFALLILANIPPAIFRIYKPERVCSLATSTFRLRRAAYILFGIALTVIFCSNLLANAGQKLMLSLPQHSAGALAGKLRLAKASAVLPDSARRINYFQVYDSEEKPAGYIFSSKDLAADVRGFGGKINLAIHVETTGKLIDFHIVRSNETPAYIKFLSQWRELLRGQELFQPEPFVDVDTVTGATVSSRAILSALEKSGNRFAGQILGFTMKPEVKQKTYWASYLPNSTGIYLIGACALALIVTLRGGFYSRLAVLVISLIIGGIVLNTQYSSEQIATLLSFHVPAIGLTGPILLAVGIPIFAAIFGNYYCGYICPFGAAQELLGYVVPERFKPAITAETMRKARFVKYVVLFVLVIAFFISRNRTTLTADPLIQIFNLRSSIFGLQPVILYIVAAAFIGSLFYNRFWCRYLCPAGAFLSLFNTLAVLKRYLPAKKFGKCEFGLTVGDQMDCLYCDRCRYSSSVAPRSSLESRTTKLNGRFLTAAVLTVAALISMASVSRFFQVTSIRLSRPAISVSVSAAGEPRDVDIERIRKMIQQKKLSDREAKFYKRID